MFAGNFGRFFWEVFDGDPNFSISEVIPGIYTRFTERIAGGIPVETAEGMLKDSLEDFQLKSNKFLKESLKDFLKRTMK